MDNGELKQRLQSIKNAIIRFGRINESDHHVIVACIDQSIKSIDETKELERKARDQGSPDQSHPHPPKGTGRLS